MAMARNRKRVPLGTPWLAVILAVVVVALGVALFR